SIVSDRRLMTRFSLAAIQNGLSGRGGTRSRSILARSVSDGAFGGASARKHLASVGGSDASNSSGQTRTPAENCASLGQTPQRTICVLLPLRLSIRLCQH